METLKKKEDKNRKMVADLQSIVEEKNKLCNELTEKLKRKEEENRKMEAELKRIVEERNKLTEEIRAKVKDGANEIAYLSDQIRPTKLSERFLEIYNNEWQDVFLESETEYYETEIIIKLYQLILQIYKFCQQLGHLL